MKIGVIGTINRDTISLPNGAIKEGWGGILYNIVTLSRLVGGRVDIYPAVNIGYDCHRRIMEIVRALPGVKVDYLRKVPEKNNHCFLTYYDYAGKSEILKGGVGPLKYDDVKPLLSCDIVLVNYISGRDIYLKSLQKLRRHFADRIYIDIHSLTLGRRKDGRRYLRKPLNWPRVVETGDYIQMNRLELDILTAEKEPGGKSSGSIVSKLETIIGILEKNRINATGKAFVVTGGANGCYIYFYQKDLWKFRHIPAQKKVSHKDTTGCGDCFSAGFIVSLLERNDLRTCGVKANLAALHRIVRNLEISNNAPKIA